MDRTRRTARANAKTGLMAAAALSAVLLTIAAPGFAHATGDDDSKGGKKDNGSRSQKSDDHGKDKDNGKDGSNGGGHTPVTLCHAKGNGEFVVITVDGNGVENGHAKHADDVIPAPAGGCPVPPPAPVAPAVEVPTSDEAANPADPAKPAKVTVCHQKGNGDFVKITIAEAGWANGHSKHDGDVLLTDPSASCPAAIVSPLTPNVPTDPAAIDPTTDATIDAKSGAPSDDSTGSTGAVADGGPTFGVAATPGAPAAPVADESAVLAASVDPALVPQVLPPVVPQNADTPAAQAPGGVVLPAAQDDGALPETGSDSIVLLTLAAAAALGGLALLGVSRRRATS